VVVLSPQYDENTDVFSIFPGDGLHAWGILLIIPLEFQEEASTIFHDTAFF